MGIAERIYETVKSLPEREAAEVLDFAEYVRARHPPLPEILTPEEHAALCAELRALVESLPMTTGGTVERMRQEARY